MNQINKEELEKCKKDVNYFIENYCTRSDSSAIELTEFQKKINTLASEGKLKNSFILHGRKQDYIMYKK